MVPMRLLKSFSINIVPFLAWDSMLLWSNAFEEALLFKWNWLISIEHDKHIHRNQIKVNTYCDVK